MSITVNGLKYNEDRNEYIANFKGKQIIVDPFVTDLIESDYEIPNSTVTFMGEWDDEEQTCFLPEAFELVH